MEVIAFSKLILDMEKNLVQEGCKPTAVQPLPPIAGMCRLDEINACDEMCVCAASTCGLGFDKSWCIGSRGIDAVPAT